MLWVYTAGFVNYRLGYAAALSVVLMALLVVVSLGELLVLTPPKRRGGVIPVVALARPGHEKTGLPGPVSYYVVASVVALIFLFPLVWAAIRSLQGVAAEGSPPTWASLVHLTAH